jgi:hypothetical protein
MLFSFDVGELLVPKDSMNVAGTLTLFTLAAGRMFNNQTQVF